MNDLDACEAYLDDVIVHSDTFQEQLFHTKALFVKLSNANLTVNLMKTEFCHAVVEYLAYIVGNGHVRPVFAKENSEFSCTPNFDRSDDIPGNGGLL